MKHITCVAVFVLLLQHGCQGVPIDKSEQGVQFIYSYEGHIDAGSDACDYRLGRWSVQGNLTVQSFHKLNIFQLNDVKTGLFNGYKEDLNYTRFEEIPKEADVLNQPFVLDIENFVLYVAANEPLWSVNLKRGIVSYMQKIQPGKHHEKSVFGNCETNTEFKKDGLIIKTINHESCNGVSYRHKSNVHPAPSSKEYNPITRNTVIEIFNKDGDPVRMNSTSTVMYKPMPNAPYSQISHQTQKFNLQTKSFDFIRIKTYSLTVEKEIFFEYGDRSHQGRQEYGNDTEVLIQKFLNSYDEFEKVFRQSPVENRKNTTKDPIQDMFFALYDIPDEDGIKKLREKIDEKANWDLYSIFVSLIPYVGTDQAVTYIYNRILQADVEVTQIYAIRFLATFPQYIKAPTNELVQSLEGLLNIENVTKEAIRTGRILSFASVVAKAYEQKYLSVENLVKYKNIYHDKFLGSEKYDDKMMYLLGLINMADGLPHDYKISIITNTSLPDNLRSLALVGFKNSLKTENPDNLFETFWSVVQNKREHQDVRVEALDLLLSSNLDVNQFNIMLKAFKNSHISDHVNDQHIANYFLTSLESMQNNTAYKEPLSDLATAAIEKENFSAYARPWATGNYRLSYSDEEENLGGYIHARTIANPTVNSPSTIQLSYNQFAWSLNTGVYSVYIKLQGAIEYLYKTSFYKQLKKNGLPPDVMKLVKDINYEMKEHFQDIHVEVVIFIDNKAVFTMFTNKDMPTQFTYFCNVFEEMITNTFTISYPVMDYTQMPSILGTPINIKNDMQDIFSFSYINNDLKYRSSWYYQTWLESYDPILDTSVSSYKYYGNEININTKLSTNLLVAAWTNQKNSMNWASDKLIGTSVENVELLQTFCPTCEGVAEIPTKLLVFEPHMNLVLDWTFVGIKWNYTREQFEDPSNDFHTGFKDIHHSNSYAIPYAKPLLVFMHFYRYMYHMKPEISRIHFNAVPQHDNGTETLIHIDLNVSPSKIADPFEDVHKNITIVVNNKILGQSDDDESYLSEWKFQYDFTTAHKYTDGKEKVKFAQKIFLKTDSNKTGMQVCSSRVEHLPAVKSDKFSILPPEDATAVNIIKIKYKNNGTRDWDLENCESNRTITLTGLYTTHEERNKKIKESADYQKCLEESKDFKFTPPTRSCISAFIESSRYDKYTVDMSLKDIAGMTETINRAFAYDKVENNKIALSLTLDPFVYMLVDKADEFFNYTSYFPYKARNPMADVYGDHDIVAGFKRSCIITPQKHRSFAGHSTPNYTDRQVAFVECFEGGQSGLTFEKIGNKHVGFKFWSGNNRVEATFHENKLKVTLNGRDIKESFTDEAEKIRIRFLDEDVILVANENVSIYYNTEYIYIKAFSLYYDLVCGICSQRCYFC